MHCPHTKQCTAVFKSLQHQKIRISPKKSDAGQVLLNYKVYRSHRNPVEKPCFEFFWGRPDCPTSPATTEVFEFPQPTMNSSQMYDYFQKTFNMDILEVNLVVV